MCFSRPLKSFCPRRVGGGGVVERVRIKDIMGGGNNTDDEGMMMRANLSQLKRKAQTKVKEFIHTAQAKREHVERVELSLRGGMVLVARTGSTR